jgi:hypothetical protein
MVRVIAPAEAKGHDLPLYREKVNMTLHIMIASVVIHFKKRKISTQWQLMLHFY